MYTPLSSAQKSWIISSTRPFSLTKLILCVCVKQREGDKLESFSTVEMFQGEILAQHLVEQIFSHFVPVS